MPEPLPELLGDVGRRPADQRDSRFGREARIGAVRVARQLVHQLITAAIAVLNANRRPMSSVTLAIVA